MRLTEIEAWAHKIIDRVERGEPNEDARVELKSQWIDDYEMARRLAGHANAARTDRILWLVGVDEKKRAAAGVSARDAADWYKSVASNFDGVPPSMTDLAVHRGDKTVMALLFETDRPPYVVKNPAFGKEKTPISYEVPWREGTAVRTARREDLFRILAPQATLPECELRQVSSMGSSHGPGGPPPNVTRCVIWLYFVPAALERTYVPFHRCAARIRTPGRDWMNLASLHFEEDMGETRGIRAPSAQRRQSHSIATSETELVIDGAGGAVLIGTYPLLVPKPGTQLGFETRLDFAAPLEIELSLSVARVDALLRVNTLLEPTGTLASNEAARWVPKASSRGDEGASETAPASDTEVAQNDEAP